MEDKSSCTLSSIAFRQFRSSDLNLTGSVPGSVTESKMKTKGKVAFIKIVCTSFTVNIILHLAGLILNIYFYASLHFFCVQKQYCRQATVLVF